MQKSFSDIANSIILNESQTIDCVTFVDLLANQSKRQQIKTLKNSRKLAGKLAMAFIEYRQTA